MYFGRTENATLETALTQTGSLKGDLNFFIRPNDGISTTAPAPRRPFLTCLTGQPASVVKPGAVEFAPNFRNPEMHQAVAAIEEPLPGHIVADRERDAQPGPPLARLHRHQYQSRHQRYANPGPSLTA